MSAATSANRVRSAAVPARDYTMGLDGPGSPTAAIGTATTTQLEQAGSRTAAPSTFKYTANDSGSYPTGFDGPSTARASNRDSCSQASHCSNLPGWGQGQLLHSSSRSSS